MFNPLIEKIKFFSLIITDSDRYIYVIIDTLARSPPGTTVGG